MVVKELRQGLRSKSFVVAFLLLQGLLVTATFVAIGGSGDYTEALNYGIGNAFIGVLAIVLLIALPIRSLISIHQESESDTLELLEMTRVGALRIVTGKWLSLSAMAVLAVVAAIPYFMLRYFVGGVELLQELLLIGTLLFSSVVLCAIGVCLSATVGRRGRHALWILTLLVGGWALWAFIWLPAERGESFGWIASWTSFFTTIGIGGFILFYALCAGATRIAPVAQNLSTIKRATSLGAATLFCVFSLIENWGTGSFGTIDWVVVVMLLVVFSMSDALCERPSGLTSVLRPFSKGPIRRVLAWIFAPGWPTGIIYSIVCMIVFGIAITSRTIDGDDWLPYWLLFSMVLMPAAVIRIAMKRDDDILGIFVVMQVIGLAILVAGVLLDSSIGDLHAYRFLAIIPHAAVLLSTFNMFSDDGFSPLYWSIGIGYTLISIGLLLLKGRGHFQEMSRRFLQISFDQSQRFRPPNLNSSPLPPNHPDA